MNLMCRNCTKNCNHHKNRLGLADHCFHIAPCTQRLSYPGLSHDPPAKCSKETLRCTAQEKEQKQKKKDKYMSDLLMLCSRACVRVCMRACVRVCAWACTRSHSEHELACSLTPTVLSMREKALCVSKPACLTCLCALACTLTCV